jgi:membrane protease YdiL (CAAX protease family)
MSITPQLQNAAIRDRSAPPSREARRRRALEGLGFVGAWVALGYLFCPNDLAYLLLGVPLTIGFQTLVRRRPLRELWVQDATPFPLDRRGLVLAAVLVAAPAYFGLQAFPGADWSLIGWYIAAAIGAFGAAFALRATTAVAMLRSAMLPLTIGAGGMTAVLGGIHVATGTPVHLVAVFGTVAKYLAIYFPLTFIIEEVAFRGALDAHTHHDGDGHGWLSAVYVSALWGLWHLPFTTGMALPLLVAELLAVHILIGVPLSFAWRRSRNLAGPAFAHAAIDAVRNALMLGL